MWKLKAAHTFNQVIVAGTAHAAAAASAITQTSLDSNKTFPYVCVWKQKIHLDCIMMRIHSGKGV